ncbi:MAG: hypothetical protein QXO69_02545 [archaeon]
MSPRVLLLMLVCLLIAFYLKMGWLITLICAALVILAIASMLPAKKPAKKPAPKGEQEIIYPVIYEDTGEPPYLFPQKFQVKAYPEEKGGTWPMWASASKAVGSMFAIGMKMLLHRGKKKKKEKEKK